MFGIGLPEFILIMALALIVVGPDKLPDLARSIAKTVLDLKKTVNTLKEDLAKENPLDSVKPELEEVANSLKKQIGEPGPDGWTGIAGDYQIVDPHEQAIRDHDAADGQPVADISEADEVEKPEPPAETSSPATPEEDDTPAEPALVEDFDYGEKPQPSPDPPAGKKQPGDTAS